MDIRLQTVGRYFTGFKGQPVDPISAIKSVGFRTAVILPLLSLHDDGKNVSFVASLSNDGATSLYLVSGFKKLELSDTLKLAKVMLRRGLYEIDFRSHFEGKEAAVEAVFLGLFSQTPMPSIHGINYHLLVSALPIIGEPATFNLLSAENWRKRLAVAGTAEAHGILGDAYAVFKLIPPKEGLKYAEALVHFAGRLEKEFGDLHDSVKVRMLAIRFMHASDAEPRDIDFQLSIIKQQCQHFSDPALPAESRDASFTARIYAEIIAKYCFDSKVHTRASMVEALIEEGNRLANIDGAPDYQGAFPLWTCAVSCADGSQLESRERLFNHMLGITVAMALTDLIQVRGLWSYLLSHKELPKHFRCKTITIMLDTIHLFAGHKHRETFDPQKALSSLLHLYDCEIPRKQFTVVMKATMAFVELHAGIINSSEFNSICRDRSIFHAFLWCRIMLANERYQEVLTFLNSFHSRHHVLFLAIKAEALRKISLHLEPTPKKEMLYQSISVSNRAIDIIAESKPEGWSDDPWLRAELWASRAFCSYQLLKDKADEEGFRADYGRILHDVAEIRRMFVSAFLVPTHALVLEAYVYRDRGDTEKMSGVAREILSMHPNNRAAKMIIAGVV